MTTSSHETELIEQNLNQLLMQKQSIQIEFNETVNALEELQKSKGDVYRMLGNIMIKSEKQSLIKELEERKKVLEMQLSVFDKQEMLFGSKLKDLKKVKSGND